MGSFVGMEIVTFYRYNVNTTIGYIRSTHGTNKKAYSDRNTNSHR